MNTAFLMVGFFFLAGGAFWLAGARHLKGDTERASSCDLTAVIPQEPQTPSVTNRPATSKGGESITYTSGFGE